MTPAEPAPAVRKEPLAGTVAVVSGAGSSNALGRTLAVAELAAGTAAGAFVLAPDDGPLWPPSERWDIPVERLPRSGPLPKQAAAADIRWIWMVKPLARGWQIAARLLEAHPEAALLVDFDDDDEALSRQFIRASFANRIRILPGRQLHPGRIRAMRRRMLARADAVTVGSYAVARKLGLEARRPLRVPHPRAPQTGRWRPPAGGDDRTHIGFFGTVRPHKGVGVLRDLLAADRSLVLHLFRGAPAELLAGAGDRVVEHSPVEPYDTLFAAVDAVILRQERSPAAEVQVPMKLVDAMAFGVPAVATPTAAITEIAGDTALYISDWTDPVAAAAVVARCRPRGEALGAAAKARFDAELSPEVTATGLRQLLESLSALG